MAPKLPIYMDNAATTPCDPRVVAAMLPYFTDSFGNAASRSHSIGWQAEEAVEYAREQIAKLIGAKSDKEIVLTSGATESDNLAIMGVANFYRDKGDHIITCKTEHKAVLDTCKRLERTGIKVTYLDPQQDGRVSAEQVKAALTDKTILVSLMLVNNEIGSVHPIAGRSIVVLSTPPRCTRSPRSARSHARPACCCTAMRCRARARSSSTSRA